MSGANGRLVLAKGGTRRRAARQILQTSQRRGSERRFHKLQCHSDTCPTPDVLALHAGRVVGMQASAVVGACEAPRQNCRPKSVAKVGTVPVTDWVHIVNLTAGAPPYMRRVRE